MQKMNKMKFEMYFQNCSLKWVHKDMYMNKIMYNNKCYERKYAKEYQNWIIVPTFPKFDSYGPIQS